MPNSSASARVTPSRQIRNSGFARARLSRRGRCRPCLGRFGEQAGERVYRHLQSGLQLSPAHAGGARLHQCVHQCRFVAVYRSQPHFVFFQPSRTKSRRRCRVLLLARAATRSSRFQAQSPRLLDCVYRPNRSTSARWRTQRARLRPTWLSAQRS